jgi:Uncharacterized protein conserved in bacteria (DUF2188)
MIKTSFKIVKHDDGWVYEANGAHSQSFRTREAARKAARLAASAASETTPLRREDKDGEWHDDTG